MTERIPANISEITFDLIIIGAGINGAGIARDASMRGLKVLVMDKADIGSGTSSASTRLIHGGLRYLEHGELGLVRESLREREILFSIAPHLVRPLPILLPIYAGRRRGRLTIRAGMVAYDLLSFDKSLRRHRMLSLAETLQEVPGINPEGLQGAAIYFDGHVEFAERLVLENVLSARENGASVLTYSRVNAFTVEQRKIRGVEFTDEFSGERHLARATIVINSAGPWVDSLLEKAGRARERLIGGTKGSHIVVRPFPGAPSSALYVEAQTDQRPFFVIPWNGNYLIGTTDARYEGDLDEVEISDAETEYLLNETNGLFPQARLRRESIRLCFSGVRPLAWSNALNEQSITRRHFVREHRELEGLYSIVGGKLTTYRRLAELTVNLVYRQLGKQPVRCSTAETPLPGAHSARTSSNFARFCEHFKRDSPLPVASNERLLRIYGTRATSILKLVTDNRLLEESFDVETGAIVAEVVFSFQHELAQTLADCLMRRTMVGLNSSRGLNAVEAAARIAQDHLAWTQGKVKREIEQYRLQAEKMLPDERNMLLKIERRASRETRRSAGS